MAPGQRPRDLELLDAVDTFPRTALQRTVWRVVRRGRDPLDVSRACGRWGDGSFDILYTAEDADGAIAEIFALLSDQPVFPSRAEWSLHRLVVTCAKALVVSSAAVLAPLGVDVSRYSERSYDQTQRIADAAVFLGFDALEVPSARWACQNLVLFKENLSAGAIEVQALEREVIDFGTWRRRTTR